MQREACIDVVNILMIHVRRLHKLADTSSYSSRHLPYLCDCHLYIFRFSPTQTMPLSSFQRRRCVGETTIPTRKTYLVHVSWRDTITHMYTYHCDTRVIDDLARV